MTIKVASNAKIIALTTIAMLAFAGNSLLCRLALQQTAIDAASFTTIRLIAGALALGLIAWFRRSGNLGKNGQNGSWLSAFALFFYATAFSFAYASLSAATGALLLFGAVQATMIIFGIWHGERFRTMQITGLLLAVAGLVGLLLPGLSAPPLWGAVLMISSGIAWGVYSLRGKGAGDPTAVTAGNFLRALPFALVLSMLFFRNMNIDTAGVAYAITSGALTSGIGYAIWYTALPSLKATHAATVQLSVPVIAALGGIVFLGEGLTLRLILASIAILGGIALVIFERRQV